MSSSPNKISVKGRHVAIIIPAYTPALPVEVTNALLNTERVLRQYGVNVSVEYAIECGLIHRVRNELVHTALHSLDGVTDIMMIDSDVVWRPEHVLRLLAMAETHPVNCGMYCLKDDEPQFRMIMDDPGDGFAEQDEFGMVKVRGVPAGFMMVRREVFEQLADRVDYYYTRHGTHKDQKVSAFFQLQIIDHEDYGEDIWFCRQCYNNGIPMWVDPAIDLIHIGRKLYDHKLLDYLSV